MSRACALAVPSNKAGSRIHIPFILFLPHPIASLAVAGAGCQKYFAEIGEMKWRLPPHSQEIARGQRDAFSNEASDNREGARIKPRDCKTSFGSWMGRVTCAAGRSVL